MALSPNRITEVRRMFAQGRLEAYRSRHAIAPVVYREDDFDRCGVDQLRVNRQADGRWKHDMGDVLSLVAETVR